MSRQCKPFLAFRFGFCFCIRLSDSDSVLMLLLSTCLAWNKGNGNLAVTYVQVPYQLETGSKDSQSGVWACLSFPSFLCADFIPSCELTFVIFAGLVEWRERKVVLDSINFSSLKTFYRAWTE